MRKPFVLLFVSGLFLVLFAQEPRSADAVERRVKLYAAATRLLHKLEAELLKRRLAAAVKNDFAVFDLRTETFLAESADMAEKTGRFTPRKPHPDRLVESIRQKIKPALKVHLFNIAGRVVGVGDIEALRALKKAVDSLRRKEPLRPVRLHFRVLRLPGRSATAATVAADSIPQGPLLRDAVVNTVSGVACELFDGRQRSLTESFRKKRTERGLTWEPVLGVVCEGLHVVVGGVRKEQRVEAKLFGELARIERIGLRRAAGDWRKVAPPVLDTPARLTAPIRLEAQLKAGRVGLWPILLGKQRLWLLLQVLK